MSHGQSVGGACGCGYPPRRLVGHGRSVSAATQCRRSPLLRRQYALKQLRKGVAVHLNFTPRCILERQALHLPYPYPYPYP